MMTLLAAGFAACSDEEETLGGKDIQFAEGTSSKIEVYADETAGTAEGGDFVHDNGCVARDGDSGDKSGGCCGDGELGAGGA